MASIGDVFQIVLTTADGNENESLNAFYYRLKAATVIPSDLPEILLDAFEDDVLIQVRNVIHLSAFLVRLDTYNLFTDDEFAEKLISIQGEASGSVAPNFTAAGFRSERKSRAIRRGQKRFGPVAEELSQGNQYLPGFLPTLENIATALGADISDGAGLNVFEPVVVKRIPYTTSGGNTAYRLPESQAELQYFIADEWEPTRPTTQSSRKV